jgi:hypothetical protein
VIIAAIGSIHVSNYITAAQGQSSSSSSSLPSQTNNSNATTQVQVAGCNATYPFFGYSPQTVQIA